MSRFATSPLPPIPLPSTTSHAPLPVLLLLRIQAFPLCFSLDSPHRWVDTLCFTEWWQLGVSLCRPPKVLLLLLACTPRRRPSASQYRHLGASTMRRAKITRLTEALKGCYLDAIVHSQYGCWNLGRFVPSFCLLSMEVVRNTCTFMSAM